MGAILSWVIGTKAGKMVAGAVLLTVLVLGLLGFWRKQEARIHEAKAKAETMRLAYENQAKQVKELENRIKQISRRKYTTTTTRPDGTTTTTSSEYEDSKEQVDRKTDTKTEPKLPEDRATWTWAPMAGAGYYGGAVGVLGVAARIAGKGPELGIWGTALFEASSRPGTIGGMAGVLVTF